MRRTSCSTLLLAATLACLGTLPAQGQDFMSKKDLQATIPGATLYGISAQDGKTRWAQTYSKGRRQGKIAGTWDGAPYSAKWKIKGDMWCEEWDGGSGCWKIVRTGAKTLQAYKDGKTKVGAVWNIK